MLISAGSGVSAAQPSGLKDVDAGTEAALSATVDVKLETTGANLVTNPDIQYTVRLKAGNRKSSVFVIDASCGSVTQHEEITLGENTSYEHTYTLEDCPNGANTLTVNITADGAALASYSNAVTITPEVPRYYLDEVTAKLGYNTPYDHDTYRQTIEVNGARVMRTELGRWEGRETRKGSYDFSATNDYMNEVKDMDIEVTPILGMNNPLYMDSGTGNGPDSKGNIDGFAKYAAAVAEQYPEVQHIEIWNEPNIAFWVNPNPIDYAYTAEVAYREVEKVNPDALIMVGSVAGGDSKFIKNFLDQGIWSNIDTVSYHPYTRPSTVDQAMEPLLLGCHDTIIEAGGWKIPICSEIGWPSNNIGIGITEEQQAIEYAKVFIFETSYGVPITIIHNTFDTNWDQSSSTEDHYGIVYPDWTPKPSFYTTREVNNQTNGAVHVGKIFFEENPDIQMHLYARDNKIHAAVWTKGDPTQINFGQSVTAYDMIGNPLGTSDTFDIGEEITYIHGLDRNWFIRGLSDTMKEIYDDAIHNLDDCKEMTGFEEACDMVYSAVDKAAELTAIPSEEEALNMLREHYAVSDSIIEMYKNNELDIPFERLTALLYINQMMGEKMVNMYMLSCETPYDQGAMTSEAAVNEAKAFIDEKRGEHTLSGAEAIWKFARERKNDAYEIAQKPGTNDMKSGYVKALDEQATLLANQAVKLGEAEEIGNANILLQLPSSQAGIDLGKDQDVNLSLYNYRTSEALTGYAEIYAPDGTSVGRSETVTLEAGESMILPVKVRVDEAVEGMFRMKFFENDEQIIERDAPVTVKDQVNIKFAPVMQTFDEIESVTVNITNVYDRDISGQINVTPRCNWTLSQTTQNFSVAQGETTSVTYQVSSKEQEPFNFYTFDIEIINSDGDVVYNKYLPIDFTVITKAEKEMSVSDFDGDISDWSDAYPIYCDTPQNPEDYNEWLEEDVGARMMMKWDENYYYMLCDVYDQFHANMQIGSNIWNGDSLQLAWDTLNDDSDSGYMSDDYEYGFALTENGVQVYTWMAGAEKTGERPTEWTSIFHSDEEHLTRYFMRIPVENLAPMSFTEGNVFGFNFLVNDADWSTREKDIEYTYGISVSKSPASFEDFKLVGVQEQVPGEPKIPLPLNLDNIKQTETSGDEGGDASGFSDTKGHWAEEYISRIANVGAISGMGDGSYQPDRNMTRAEFVTALTKCAGMSSAQSKASYFDVPADAWFAIPVALAKDAGWIPDEMAALNFYPNKEITRQEAFYIANKWLMSKSPAAAEYKFMAGISDAADIAPWAAEAFQNLYNYGVVSGDDNGLLNPNAAITRAEAAKILEELLDL